jgi:hypothetical protein
MAAVIRMLRITTLVALVLIAVMASSAHAAGPTLTASQYRAQANAICTDLENYTPPSGALVHSMEAVLAKAHDSLRALKKLKPPHELAALHSQVTVLISREGATVDSLFVQLRTGKLSESQFRAAVGGMSGKKERALWAKLGAKVCAKP